MSVNAIRHLIERASVNVPEKTALRCAAKELSYAALLEQVNKVAHYLSTLKLLKGSRIGIYSDKSMHQVIAILALLSSEHVFVPITRLLKNEQVRHIMNDCQMAAIITDAAHVETVLQTGFGGSIITYTPHEKSAVAFEEIFKCYDGSFTCNIHGFDNAAITYSFGSSGNPRGIVIDHRSLMDGARIVTNYLNITSDDVISGILSFNLDYGLNQIFCALYAQATLALHHFVLASDFFDHLINDEVTVLALMPIHITKMFDIETQKIPNSAHLKALRAITSSGGNITNVMLKNISTYCPASKFYAMHGLTEAFRSAYLDPMQIQIRPASIGKAIPDVELYIINEAGEACAPREIGELIHRGAGIYKGYWNAPEETAKRFKSIKILEKVIPLENGLNDEIVVASGDYVYKDEEGYLYFVSRKDDMIKTQGYRVSPFEIESVLNNAVPAITACAVFSIPNSEIEEEIILVYNADHELSKNEIIFELKKHLPHYMIPSQIFYNRDMPLRSLHDRAINTDELKRQMLESHLI